MWIKNLRQRKLQTLLMFLIIMICTMLLAGALSILTSLEKPCKDFANDCNAVTAKIYPYTNDEDKIHTMGEQFSKLTNVESVIYLKSHYINENIFLNGKKVEVFANLTEYNDDIFGSSIYLEGDKERGKSLKANECILPVCLSNEFDIHVGDTVTVALSNQDVVLKVIGVYTDPYQTSTAYDSDILIAKLPSIESILSINIYGKDGVTGKQIEEAYRESNNGIFHGYFLSLEDRISNGLLVGRIIGAIFLAIGIIMLLVSGLMIYYMIKNAMIADAKSIAVLKTVGYTPNDIMGMYLKLYLLVVTLACLFGVIGSIFVSNTILTSIYENMGQLKTEFSLISGLLCYLVILCFILVLIVLIIKKTIKIKPVYALTGSDYGGVKKKKYYKGNSALQFSVFGIAYRSIMREKRNAISIIITCIVTIFSVNFIVISIDVANNMMENNDFWIGVDKADVMVNISDSENYNWVKRIVEKDDRTDYLLRSNYESRITMEWKKGMSSTIMSAFVYDDFAAAKLPVTQGRDPNTSKEIAISTFMANDLNKSIGDYIEIYLDEDTKVNLLITGFFQSYMQLGRTCRLTTSAYTENNIASHYNNLSVYLNNKKDITSFIQDMKKQLGGKGKVLKRTEQYSSIMNMIVVPQQKAIPPVAVLIILIAGVNIFSIVFMKNLKTHKINSIYKCIGYTTWHLIGSNLCYVAVIALLSVVITFPISLLTYAPIMKLCLSMFSFTEYPMQFYTTHLLIANAIVVAIFMLSTLASSKSLFKINARELVQE